ncbi:MAG TPA: winged helix-turn-helix domain-containing protein, partial [Vicinamibacterales bacterium]
MPDANFRFGPFLVDRRRYCVLRDDRSVELTPKLLDLLIHLLDHAGSLVTKEQLLDALWPDANVTDNALTQAVSELRDALGDDAGSPQFIKTVARRGYRFVAPVTRIEVSGSDSRAGSEERVPARPARGARGTVDSSIAVMDFANVTGDADSAWLSAGIAETVTSDLRNIGPFRVVDRGRVKEAVRRTDGSVHAVSADLGTTFTVVGSYQTHADRIRITARIVSAGTGEAVADAKVDGP